MHVLDNNGRSTQRAAIVWSDSESCTAAADRKLTDLGYQRLTDWTNHDGNPPPHPIGTRNGWHFATISALAPHQP